MTPHADITWKGREKGPDLSYIGRNGSGKCRGLSINQYSDFVTMSPLNSKGNVGNCLIDIPTEAIPELVQRLIPLDKILEAARDRLPTLLGLDPVLDKIVETGLKSGSDVVSPGQETE